MLRYSAAHIACACVYLASVTLCEDILSLGRSWFEKLGVNLAMMKGFFCVTQQLRLKLRSVGTRRRA